MEVMIGAPFAPREDYTPITPKRLEEIGYKQLGKRKMWQSKDRFHMLEPAHPTTSHGFWRLSEREDNNVLYKLKGLIKFMHQIP